MAYVLANCETCHQYFPGKINNWKFYSESWPSTYRDSGDPKLYMICDLQIKSFLGSGSLILVACARMQLSWKHWSMFIWLGVLWANLPLRGTALLIRGGRYRLIWYFTMNNYSCIEYSCETWFLNAEPI